MIQDGNTILKVLTFTENSYRQSDDFNVVESSFQMLEAVSKKAHLLIFILVLGTKSCLVVNDLNCLWIFDSCRRPGK